MKRSFEVFEDLTESTESTKSTDSDKPDRQIKQKNKTFYINEEKLFKSIKYANLTLNNLYEMLTFVKNDIMENSKNKNNTDVNGYVEESIEHLCVCTIEFCQLMDINPSINIMTAIMRTNLNYEKINSIKEYMRNSTYLENNKKLEYLFQFENIIKRFGTKETYICTFLFEFYNSKIIVSYYEAPTKFINICVPTESKFKIFGIENNKNNQTTHDCFSDDNLEICDVCDSYNNDDYWYQRDSFS